MQRRCSQSEQIATGADDKKLGFQPLVLMADRLLHPG
jgi:hypothetical protein